MRTTAAKVASPSTLRTVELTIEPSRLLAPAMRADRLVEAQRIDDAVAREGVDHEPLLVGGDDLLRGQVEIEDAPVEIDHVLDRAAP